MSELLDDLFKKYKEFDVKKIKHTFVNYDIENIRKIHDNVKNKNNIYIPTKDVINFYNFLDYISKFDSKTYNNLINYLNKYNIHKTLHKLNNIEKDYLLLYIFHHDKQYLLNDYLIMSVNEYQYYEINKIIYSNRLVLSNSFDVLFHAIVTNNLKMLVYLNQFITNCNLLFYIAVNYSNINIIKYLSKSCDVKDYYVALSISIENNNQEKIDYFVDLLGKPQDFILSYINDNNYEAVKILLKNGAEANSECLNASINMNNLKITKLLIENGAKITRYNIILSMGKCDVDIFLYLCNHALIRDDDEGLLITSAKFGCLNVFYFLINKIKLKSDITLFKASIIGGNVEIVKYVLNMNDNVRKYYYDNYAIIVENIIIQDNTELFKYIYNNTYFDKVLLFTIMKNSNKILEYMYPNYYEIIRSCSREDYDDSISHLLKYSLDYNNFFSVKYLIDHFNANYSNLNPFDINDPYIREYIINLQDKKIEYNTLSDDFNIDEYLNFE